MLGRIKRREICLKSLTFLFFLLFSIWVFLQFLAPLVLPKNSVQDLSGSVAISDNDQIIQKINFPYNIFYTAGDRLCHQQAARSIFINGNQMPFCSRCTGIWVGFAIGLGFMVVYRFKLTEKFLFVILIGLGPIGVDGVGQLAGFWESTNSIRIATGLLAGVVCGVAIALIIDETSEIRKEKKKK